MHPSARARTALLGAAIVTAVGSAAWGRQVAPGAPSFVPGDTWNYERSIQNGTSSFSSQKLIIKIERLNSDNMVIGLKPDGSPVDFEDHIVGLDWSQHKVVEGQQVVSGRPFEFPLTPGKTWSIAYHDPTRHGLEVSSEHAETYKVVGWEDVTTPAGSFHALRIDADDKIKAHLNAAGGLVTSGVATADGSTVVAHTDHSAPRDVYVESMSSIYYVPSIKYYVKTVEDIYNADNVRTTRRTDTLVSFKAGG